MALTLTVRPRLQRETWSLYWRETMATETTCAADVALPMLGGGEAEAGPAPLPAGAAAAAAASPPRPPPLPAAATVRDALRAAAEACGWPPVGSLVRLEGFEAPFERCLVRGVEVGLDEPVAQFAAAAAMAAEAAAGASDLAAAAAAAAAAGKEAGAAPLPPLVYVRTVLAAEGWRLANDPQNDPAGYSTSDSDGSSSDGDSSNSGGRKA